MTTETVAMLEALYTAYREKRLADVLDHLAGDFRFTLHLPPAAVPGAGVPQDKQRTQAMLQAFIDSYDFLTYDPGAILVEGEQATAHPLIRYRHKATGEVIETRMAHLWVVRNGKAVELDEYLNVGRVQAFLAKVSELSSG
ncbi:MAG TPA: nuclear transport factor 2 family protein [Hyphomicrobiaceae bacterium]|nr:nuclear transport factor 2 family protein [Hyphomicrobiaceae bacterium]